jgi:hypothetical protein
MSQSLSGDERVIGANGRSSLFQGQADFGRSRSILLIEGDDAHISSQECPN